uniref:hypothetical protein n=1 Tax=Frigoribacterium sp. CFBP 8751 TaxID=2775277 RepID=UPI0020181B8F|nr:hypothetical protein [Frigoribacterium sp. CFBP 8751]
MDVSLDPRQEGLGHKDSIKGTARLGHGVHFRHNHEVGEGAGTVALDAPEFARVRGKQLCEALFIEFEATTKGIAKCVCRYGSIALVDQEVDNSSFAGRYGQAVDYLDVSGVERAPGISNCAGRTLASARNDQPIWGRVDITEAVDHRRGSGSDDCVKLRGLSSVLRQRPPICRQPCRTKVIERTRRSCCEAINPVMVGPLQLARADAMSEIRPGNAMHPRLRRGDHAPLAGRDVGEAATNRRGLHA